MPFGLCNVPSTFQRLMVTLLRILFWKHRLVYLDDVIVFAPDYNSLSLRLEKIFTSFKQAYLRLKPSKCMFAMTEVAYLGYRISKEGLGPDPNKTKVIKEMKPPNSKEQVKRLLGMLSYYRSFI